MPEAILKRELYPLFGGYWGYRAAPLDEVIRQRCVLTALNKVKKRKYDEIEAQQEALRHGSR